MWGLMCGDPCCPRRDVETNFFGFISSQQKNKGKKKKKASNHINTLVKAVSYNKKKSHLTFTLPFL